VDGLKHGSCRRCQTRRVQPRRLVLLRHAKAADGPIDADRPLTERGTRRAIAVGTWLEQAGLLPDRVLVSPARRAVQTWEQAGARLPRSPRPIVDPRIYDNTVEDLITAIGETPEDVRTLAVVGHNPSIGELAAVLDNGQGNPAARRDVEAGFPTGGVAVFTLPTPFAAIAPGAARLDDVAVRGD
jgi:phosphohistidine phosphatase